VRVVSGGAAAAVGAPARDERCDEERCELRRSQVAELRGDLAADRLHRWRRALREDPEERSDRFAGAGCFFASSAARRLFSWNFFAADLVLHAFSWRFPSAPVQRAYHFPYLSFIGDRVGDRIAPRPC